MDLHEEGQKKCIFLEKLQQQHEAAKLLIDLLHISTIHVIMRWLNLPFTVYNVTLQLWSVLKRTDETQ